MILLLNSKRNTIFFVQDKLSLFNANTGQFFCNEFTSKNNQLKQFSSLKK